MNNEVVTRAERYINRKYELGNIKPKQSEAEERTTKALMQRRFLESIEWHSDLGIADGYDRLIRVLCKMVRGIVLNYDLRQEFVGVFLGETWKRYCVEYLHSTRQLRTVTDYAEYYAYSVEYARRRVRGKQLIQMRGIDYYRKLVKTQRPLSLDMYNEADELAAKNEIVSLDTRDELARFYNFIGREKLRQFFLLRVADVSRVEQTEILDVTLQETDHLQQNLRYQWKKFQRECDTLPRLRRLSQRVGLKGHRVA